MAAITSTSISTPKVEELIELLSELAMSVGAKRKRISENHLKFKRFGFQVEAIRSGNELQFILSAPTRSALSFVREGANEKLRQIDYLSGHEFVWKTDSKVAHPDGTPIDFQELVLSRRTEIIPGMMRLTFQGDRIEELNDKHGIHVKLIRPKNPSVSAVQWPTVGKHGVLKWPTGEQSLTARTYTIRNARPDKNEVDIDVVKHAGGAISDWAQIAQPGEVVGVIGPSGGSMNYPETSDGAILLVGDETALPAIARTIDHMPEGQRGLAVVAMPFGSKPSDYLSDNKIKVVAIEQERFRRDCYETTRGLVDEMQRYSYAFFGGEAENAKQMRRLFKEELGLKKGEQLSVAYWSN